MKVLTLFVNLVPIDVKAVLVLLLLVKSVKVIEFQLKIHPTKTTVNVHQELFITIGLEKSISVKNVTTDVLPVLLLSIYVKNVLKTDTMLLFVLAH
jgi:hypothetical protein